MIKQNFILVLLLMLPGIILQAAVKKAQTPPGEYGASITNGNVSYGHQEDRPFAMHSVMKFPQALQVADYLEKQGLALTDSVPVCKDSLDAGTWSPMLATFGERRFFTFAELLKWSLAESDNNACDLLFAYCGAPAKVEDYLCSLGFNDIHVRLTEKEMKLNPHRAGENCSTPGDMVRLLEWFFRHRSDNIYLSFIWDTMADCHTGSERIAAVLPETCLWVHKTGTGFSLPDGRQDRNDVGVILFPDGSHLSIAVFVPDATEEKNVASLAQQSLMRVQADAFLQNMPSYMQQRQTSAIRKATD